jgi:tetratricopeptide (TPR) repeat protein
MKNFSLNFGGETHQVNNLGVAPDVLEALVKQHGEHSKLLNDKIGQLESALNLNVLQVRAALEIVGQAQIAPEHYGAKLIEIAERFKELVSIISADPTDSPAVHKLKSDAEKAIKAGELANADQLLAKIEAEQKGALNHLILGAAETTARRGDVALARLRYKEAAMHFARAASQLSANHEFEDRWIAFHRRAFDSLFNEGNEFGDNDALRAAIEYGPYPVSLPLRARAPLQWAEMLNSLGRALSVLGLREPGTELLEQAVHVYRTILDERTRERVPYQWAVTQSNLGGTYFELYNRKNDGAWLLGAIQAYRDALGELTRERAPRDWALTQNNLGIALRVVGERTGDVTYLDKAVDAHRAALEEYTRERVPLDWGWTQSNLAFALVALGQSEKGTARLEEAVLAFRAALEEQPRERMPLDWATTQHGMGGALCALGRRKSDTELLNESVRAFRAAQEILTRDRAALDWTVIQYNLATALQELGERDSGTALLQQSAEAYRAALEGCSPEHLSPVWNHAQTGLKLTLELLKTRTELRGASSF